MQFFTVLEGIKPKFAIETLGVSAPQLSRPIVRIHDSLLLR